MSPMMSHVQLTLSIGGLNYNVAVLPHAVFVSQEMGICGEGKR